MSRWAVVLAGGVGSRFWPLSTPARPKQLLPLVGERALLFEAVERLGPLVPAERTLILTAAALRDDVQSLLPHLPPRNIVTEPRAAGTAPALAWAAKEIASRDGDAAVMMSVHADWSIADADGFRDTLARAAEAAERHRALVTVGIVPGRPDVGFGYIHPGDAVDGARRVRRFVEKPDRASAERMVREGYLWNSGIFVWRVGDFLEEVRAHAPDIASALARSSGSVDAFFSAVTPISVDHGVLERSSRVLVLPGDFGWDDVGTWAALHRVRRRDASGNAVHGDVHAVDARDNVVHADAGTVVLYGVADLVVVSRAGLTLVTTRERAADLKQLVDRLPREVREAR